MNLSVKEKRLLFQLESCEKDKVINELAVIVECSKNTSNYDVASSLLKKFCGLPESEIMTDKGYEKLLDEQQCGHVLLKNHAKVRNGHLLYDNRNHDL